MHLADGVLSTQATVATTVVAGALLANAIRQVDAEEEIPKLSLMTAAFFVFALMSFKAGPSSVHPLLGGLLGIVLGWKAPIAVFIGLVLQASLFGHGGLTALGINTIMVSLPAIAAHLIFSGATKKGANPVVTGGISAAVAVLLTVAILITVLSMTSDGFKEIIGILIMGHLPLALAEGVLTAVVIKFLMKTRPEVLGAYNLSR